MNNKTINKGYKKIANSFKKYSLLHLRYWRMKIILPLMEFKISKDYSQKALIL